MNEKRLKIVAISLLVLCSICFFIEARITNINLEKNSILNASEIFNTKKEFAFYGKVLEISETETKFHYKVSNIQTGEEIKLTIIADKELKNLPKLNVGDSAEFITNTLIENHINLSNDDEIQTFKVTKISN